MSDSGNDSVEARRELLIRYLDGSLEDDETTEVEHLIENDRNAFQDLQEIQRLTAMIKEHGTLFCPDPVVISDFVEAGTDPEGRIAEHLRTCHSCQRDADMLRASSPEETMPRELFESVRAELPGEPVGETGTKHVRGLLESIQDYAALLLRPRIFAAGAAALAVLLLILVYPPDSKLPTIVLSKETWNHIGNSLPSSLFGKWPATKPHLAIILAFEDFKTPLSQEQIDALYKALKPSKEDLDRFEVVAPAKLSRIIAENKLKTTDMQGILGTLRKDLDLQEVVVVTVKGAGDRYGIRSKLIKTATGKVVEEHATEASSYSELIPKLRQTTYAVIGGSLCD